MKLPLPVRIIRAVSEQDIRAIGLLYPSKSPGERDEMVRRSLLPELRQQDKGKRAILLARLEERVVGTVQVIWEAVEENIPWQPGSVIVHHLRTHPDLQGQGIATQLFDAAKMLATDRGVTTLTLGVEPSNDRARRIYAAWGFEEYARYKGEDGKPIIAMKMALDGLHWA